MVEDKIFVNTTEAKIFEILEKLITSKAAVADVLLGKLLKLGT